MKWNSDSEVGSRVHDLARGVKVSAAGVDFHHDGCSLRQGIGHIDVAAVKTEFAHSGRDTCSGRCVNDFGGGHERESGGATSLLSHAFHLEGNRSTTVVRQWRKKPTPRDREPPRNTISGRNRQALWPGESGVLIPFEV